MSFQVATEFLKCSSIRVFLSLLLPVTDNDLNSLAQDNLLVEPNNQFTEYYEHQFQEL